MRVGLLRLVFVGLMLSSIMPILAEESKQAGEGGSLEKMSMIEDLSTLEDMPERKTRFWELSLTVGQEYETNVKLDDSASQKDDTKTVFGVDAKIHLPRFQGVETTVGYSLYRDMYAKLDGLSLEGNTVSVNLERAITEDIFAYLDYSYLWFEFDSKGYLQRHTVASSYYWAQHESFAAFVRLSWDNNDYLQVQELSGDNYAISIREFYFWGARREANVWINYSANYNKATSSVERYNGHQVSIGTYSPLWWKVSAQASFSYGRNSYKEGDARFQIAGQDKDNFRRRDNIFRTNLSFSRPIWGRSLTMRIFHSFTRQRSSLNGRDYSDQTIGVETRLKF